MELLAAPGHDLRGALEGGPVPAQDGIPDGVRHWHTTQGRDVLEQGLVEYPVEDAASLPGVVAVHDLHIWAMSTTEVALTVHLVMQPVPSDDRFLHDLCHELQARYGIGHTTTQIEHGSDEISCHQAPAHVV